MNPNISSKPKFTPFSGVKIEHLLAGISGGVASTLLLHPLDLMKIRFAGKPKINFLFLSQLFLDYAYFVAVIKYKYSKMKFER